MCMFVGVNMSDCNARALELADLGGRFSFDLRRIDSTGCYSHRKAGQALGEATTSRGDEAADPISGQDRAAVHQHHVTTDCEFRLRPCQSRRIVKGGGVGHQGCGSHDAFRTGLHDGSIHTGREAEIVRVYNETPQRVSLAGEWPSPIDRRFRAGIELPARPRS